MDLPTALTGGCLPLTPVPRGSCRARGRCFPLASDPVTGWVRGFGWPFVPSPGVQATILGGRHFSLCVPPTIPVPVELGSTDAWAIPPDAPKSVPSTDPKCPGHQVLQPTFPLRAGWGHLPLVLGEGAFSPGPATVEELLGLHLEGPQARWACPRSQRWSRRGAGPSQGWGRACPEGTRSKPVEAWAGRSRAASFNHLFANDQHARSQRLSG